MKRHPIFNLILAAAGLCILLPMALLLVWSAAARWPWPDLLPEEYSLRTVRELLFGTASLPALVGSSTLLALVVAVLGTTVGLLTARATELYDIPGKSLVRFGTFLPLLVPGTVFAMGIQITLIRLGLADTAAGVVLVHTIVAMPYCTTILTDVTRAVGVKYEEQAAVLGAGPVRAFFQASLPALLPGVLSSMSMGFILSSSQYFTTLMVGGGRVRTLALVLVPYIQSGDRSLSAIYSVAFAGSALAVFFVLEGLLHLLQKRRVIL